ncbi:MAG: TolC family protein [Helicobacteraceae bacterium]|jgi:outer membrane protein TolC|nr:TolC family protein [Helicobacteraceae bacterium]
MLARYLLVLFFSIAVSQAQHLTLEECVVKAIDTHPDIKRALLDVKKSSSGVDAADADYLPQVTLNAEYDPYRTYVLPQNGTFNTIGSDGWQAGATLNQKIWDFSKTTSTIKSFETQESIAKLSLQDAKALMAYNVKLQYELILVYIEAIDVRRKDREAKKELYKQAKALVKLGMKTKADATRFLSSFYVAQDNLGIAEANYDKARISLSSYIGDKVEKDVVLEDSIANNTFYVEDQLLYDAVLQNNPELKSIAKTVEKDELIYKATKSSHYGSIDAVASYNYQNTLNSYDTTLLGITLTIPLYSGGRTSALVQTSLLERERTKELLNAKELALQEEFASLIIDLKRYEQTIKAKEAQLQASEETKMVLDARYKQGLSTYIEVLDANALYLDAKLGLLEAKYAKSSIVNRIVYLQGNIL